MKFVFVNVCFGVLVVVFKQILLVGAVSDELCLGVLMIFVLVCSDF